MTRRKWIVLGILAVVVTGGAELVVRPWNPPKSAVQITNDGTVAIDNLVVIYGRSKLAVGRVDANQTINVWFTSAGAGVLILEFDQTGNPMKGFKVEDFDPDENLRLGIKLALIIKNNEVVRFMEDDQSATPVGDLVNKVKDWFVPETVPAKIR